MKMTGPFMRSRRVILMVLFFIISINLSTAQTYTFFYRVYFTDKGANSPAGFSADQLLSRKAIDRRLKSGIEVPDYRDLPVFSEYIRQVTQLGFRLHCTSRWMNTALFKTTSLANIAPVEALPFVSSVKIVRNNVVKSVHSDKLDFAETTADFPPYDRQISMLNGNPIHNSGFKGSGILIAVLDGGFLYADKATSLVSLRSRNGIKYTYDFVAGNRNVYSYHTHGTAVLSVLAGQIYEAIAGTAPDADFFLLRTEDTSSEFPVEEDFWAAGAEFADSAGADIISSSLGYSTFDDTDLNHKFSDLNGNTTFISQVADIAASKGILVVNSAGNERNKYWIRIIAPADGDSVLTAGAVDGNNVISAFSSSGPSADGQVKPDNSALGVSIVVQSSENQLARSSGTSFSCPVLSGMAACLLEAVPEASNIDIINALHASADRYYSPDSLYGYGIPDMVKALDYLQDIYLQVPGNGPTAGPNPTRGEIEFIFRDDPEYITAEVVTSSGMTIFNKEYEQFAGRSFILNTLKNREQGIYLVKLTTGTGTYKFKIVKLND